MQDNIRASARLPVQVPIDPANQEGTSVQIQTNTRSILNELPAQMPPSVQINIQSLIKPMKTPDKPQPLVYTFGQPDFGKKLLDHPEYTSKYLPSALSGVAQNRAKKISWNFEYPEDDFADILGWVKLDWLVDELLILFSCVKKKNQAAKSREATE